MLKANILLESMRVSIQTRGRNSNSNYFFKLEKKKGCLIGTVSLKQATVSKVFGFFRIILSMSLMIHYLNSRACS